MRLATDPSGATIGAGAYDAWGNARPYAGGSGATQLAGLQGVVPFGYAGQQRDAGPGTYAMRARRYDPTQGRFQSQDPLAYSPQVPVTINPYEYAGNMPSEVTDPSGQGWLPPNVAGPGDYYPEYYIGADLAIGKKTGRAAPSSQTEFDVPVYPNGDCNRPGATVYSANIVRIDAGSLHAPVMTGEVWDLEHVQAFARTGGVAAISQGLVTKIILGALTGGLLWGTSPSCDGSFFLRCGPREKRRAALRLGGDYPGAFGLKGTTLPGSPLVTRVVTGDIGEGNLYFAYSAGPGLILYDRVRYQPCPYGITFAACWLKGQIQGAYDVATSNANVIEKGFVVLGTLAMFGSGAVGLVRTGRAVAGAGDAAVLAADAETLSMLGRDGTDALARDLRLFRKVAATCATCFPSETEVATPRGHSAIAALRAGDTVLSEDPRTGKVDPEVVQTVLDDGVKPLIALDLSDGSTIRATANHLFWVEGGPGSSGAGWLEAGQIRPGDRLRTAAGTTVAVIRVRWNAGEAEVYTLTVASDHTFFVGTARVLVHNAGPCDVTFEGRVLNAPQDVIDSPNNNVRGRWGEEALDDAMEQVGYYRVGGHPAAQSNKPGIDGIYKRVLENSQNTSWPELVVGEAKTKFGQQISKRRGRQMEVDWIEEDLPSATAGNPALLEQLQANGYGRVIGVAYPDGLVQVKTYKGAVQPQG